MIFLTVGSALPFDRLVKLVDEANQRKVFDQSIFAQIGLGNYQPESFECTDFLDHVAYIQNVSEATTVISHAGIGSINACLRIRKAMLVMPRRKSFGELVDDHQVRTAEVFSQRGHVLAFETISELEQGLRKLPGFVPTIRTPDPNGIANEIERFIHNQLQSEKAPEKEVHP